MLIEKGTVEAAAGGKARIKTDRASACGECGQKGACHSLGGSSEMVVTVDNPVGARPGDFVEVRFETKSFLVGSFLLYFVPILGFLIGVILGQAMGPSFGLGTDGGAILGGLVLLAVFGLISRAIGRKLSDKPKYQPTISRILTLEEFTACSLTACEVPPQS